MTIHALAAMKQGEDLQDFQYESAALGPTDLKIAISHCGICHSDLHLLRNDWGISRYPLVPGHEIVGTVVEVGSAVDPKLLSKRVGVGWQSNSCKTCSSCICGEDNLCVNSQATCVGAYGGFAQAIKVDSRFAFEIPDALDSAAAGPLLCAGVTVYNPLRRWDVTAKRVAVVGIGGLGHLAVQFAKKLGNEVIAISGSESKKEEAQELGADHFVNGRDPEALKSLRRSVDFVISTVFAPMDMKPYLSMLGANGTFCFVGAPSEPISFPPAVLMDLQRSVTASSIGGPAIMREMLQFAAVNQVAPWIEKLPMDSANTALERLEKNDVRYRFVLEN